MISGDYVYALGNLSTAVEELATDEGDVRRRVTLAFVRLSVLRSKDFPPALRKEWGWIEEQCTKLGPLEGGSGEILVGAIQNTLRRTPRKRAVEIAKRIWRLYWELKDVVESPTLDSERADRSATSNGDPAQQV